MGSGKKKEMCKTTTKEKNDDYDFATDSFFLFCTKKITKRTNKKFCVLKKLVTAEVVLLTVFSLR